MRNRSNIITKCHFEINIHSLKRHITRRSHDEFNVTLNWGMKLPKHWPAYASLFMIAWAAALQYHMRYIQSTPSYQAKFKDMKPVEVLGTVWSARSKDEQ